MITIYGTEVDFSRNISEFLQTAAINEEYVQFRGHIYCVIIILTEGNLKN